MNGLSFIRKRYNLRQGQLVENSSVYQSMRKPVETGARGSKVAMLPFF